MSRISSSAVNVGVVVARAVVAVVACVVMLASDAELGIP